MPRKSLCFMARRIDHFTFSGQALAQQMQQSNPELVEQLRRQMGGPGGPGAFPPGPGGPLDPPPPSS